MLTAAISGIADDAWTEIKYPNAVWKEGDDHPDGGYWVSDAEVAETRFTALPAAALTSR